MTATTKELPLFPLGSVVVPGARLALQVFEARYLDLMSRCLRENTGFGIVWLSQGAEVRRPGDEPPVFANVGVTAKLDKLDMPQAGLMHVQVRALGRFRVHTTTCRDNGLWVAQVSDLPDDPATAPAPEHELAVAALSAVAERLEEVGRPLADVALDDASWVSLRWLELLPMEMERKQTWMAMPDPLARLTEVTNYLRDNGVFDAADDDATADDDSDDD